MHTERRPSITGSPSAPLCPARMCEVLVRILAIARVVAIEPAHAQVDPERPPERGQIGWAPPIAAVDRPARTPAIRAAAARSRAVRGDVEETRAVTRDPLDAAARHRTELVHAPSYGVRPATLQTPVLATTIHAKCGRAVPKGQVQPSG